jgi:DNA replication protein DnaC
MASMGEGMAQLIGELSGVRSASEEYICPHCKQSVPKKVIRVLDREFVVQPVCACEWKAIEAEQRRKEREEQMRKIDDMFGLPAIDQRFAGASFENYTIRPGSENAYRFARRYAESFNPENYESLMLWGDPGNGKTHLAAAVRNHLRGKGKIVVFMCVPELLAKIRSTFGGRSKESEAEIMRGLMSCELLILDDIGAEKLTDWVQDVMFRIIDGRYRTSKPTMYTSNLSPNDLRDRLGQRIYDRVIECSLAIENKATSYREEKAQARLNKILGIEQ